MKIATNYFSITQWLGRLLKCYIQIYCFFVLEDSAAENRKIAVCFPALKSDIEMYGSSE